MSTSQRAMFDPATDTATPAPFPGTSGGLVVLDRTDGSATPEDIAVSRLRALAERLAGNGDAVSSDDGDGSLTDADEIIVAPVSLTTMVAMRRLQAPADLDEDLDGDLSADEAAAPPEEAPANAIVAESSPDAEPTSEFSPALPIKASDAEEEAAELDVVASLAPVPLRLADETGRSLTTTSESAPSDESPETESADSEPEAAPLMRRIVQSAEPPLMLSDQSAADIRLVDLIRRQQTLLDRLHRYPPTPGTSESGASSTSAAPSSTEPPPELTFSSPPRIGKALPDRETTIEAIPALPPPLPPSSDDEPDPEDAGPQLPERAPIIIQRAHAERSGRYDPSSEYTPPSVMPAFAAGLALACVVAGSLFYLL